MSSCHTLCVSLFILIVFPTFTQQQSFGNSDIPIYILYSDFVVHDYTTTLDNQDEG